MNLGSDLANYKFFSVPAKTSVPVWPFIIIFSFENHSGLPSFLNGAGEINGAAIMLANFLLIYNNLTENRKL
jgi:hypothetical protein